jgi:hypothetical protein
MEIIMKKYNPNTIYVLQNKLGWTRIVCLNEDLSWHVEDEYYKGGPAKLYAEFVLNELVNDRDWGYEIIQEWK